MRIVAAVAANIPSSRVRGVLAAAVPFFLGACSELGSSALGGSGTESETGPPQVTTDDEASGGGGPASTGDEAADGSESGGPAGEGLPCDVDRFLRDRCHTCHAGNPMVSATLLRTRDDLLADSLSQPGTSVGAVAAVRLADGAMLPMPPLPASPVPSAERDAFVAWVDAGMPAGDCQPDDEPDPFDADPVCTSERWWTEGLFESSPHMNPGRACISCHEDPASVGGGEKGEEEDEEGPTLVLGGTLFPTAHEPDDCYGVDGPATSGDLWIEVSQPMGPTLMVSVRESGNFYLEPGDVPPGFAPPFLVKVVADGLERPMADPAPHGDCNLCHTQVGMEDAPGRIILP
jgi:hypothetical protein